MILGGDFKLCLILSTAFVFYFFSGTYELVGTPLVENCLSGFNNSVFSYGQQSIANRRDCSETRMEEGV